MPRIQLVWPTTYPRVVRHENNHSDEFSFLRLDRENKERQTRHSRRPWQAIDSTGASYRRRHLVNSDISKLP